MSGWQTADRRSPSTRGLAHPVEATRPRPTVVRLASPAVSGPSVASPRAYPELAAADVTAAGVVHRGLVAGSATLRSGLADEHAWRETADPWVSTEVAARRIGGVTPRWVRLQIDAGRLRARVLLTGRRVTYRIRLDELERFIGRYIVDDAWARTDGRPDDLAR